MKRAVILAGSIGFFGSILSIAVAYADWYLIDISVRDALKPIWIWPVLSMAFLLTTLSLAVPFVAYYFRGRESAKENLLSYAFGFLWIPFLIFHPGVRALGVASDDAGFYAGFGVCFSQYIAARLTYRALEASPESNSGAA